MESDLNKIKDLIISKIDRLLNQGCNVEYLPSTECSSNIIKIDKIIVRKSSITSYKNISEANCYEPEVCLKSEVCLEFERYPILSGPLVDEIYKHIFGNQASLIERYLNS